MELVVNWPLLLLSIILLIWVCGGFDDDPPKAA